MNAARRRGRPVAAALDLLRARKMVQRAGVMDEPPVPLPTDHDEVRQLLSSDALDERLRRLAEDAARPVDEVRAEAAGYLREMAATHEQRPGDAWQRFSDWALRAYDVYVDDDSIARLRAIDRRTSLAFLFSHRSYLDGVVLPSVLKSRGFAPTFGFAGANLNFFPLGGWASRTGLIFIRRDTKDVPVYRLALRSYIGQLARNRANMSWSIEGGRTRTGKLRPPVYGILRYLVDGLDEAPEADVRLVPVSIVYDQLHEVALMAGEARGGAKRPENLAWMMRYARQQRHRLGRVYLDFGEPVPLRERLDELRADPATGGHEVERIAVDVSHRINRATPVTPTAVVSLALLGADRALNLDEVLDTVRPLAAYVAHRNWPVAGAANLTDRATIRRTLQELVASGVLNVFEEGTEPVWTIGSGQHLVAAFYRNMAIHMMVDRAIAELGLQAVREGGNGTPSIEGGAPVTVRAEALRLRELLKFEFFFSARSGFEAELDEELALLGAPPSAAVECTPEQADKALTNADLLLAHQVLRPFLDAYHIVADRLAAYDDDEFDEQRFLDSCLRIGKQWQLQRKITSAESISLELFKNALRLARHNGLVGGREDDPDGRRAQFAAEARAACRRVNQLAELARDRSTRS